MTKSKNKAYRMSVYLGLRHLIKEDATLTRAEIKRIVSHAYQHDDTFLKVIGMERPVASIVSTAISLWENGVFSSSRVAKYHFPAIHVDSIALKTEPTDLVQFDVPNANVEQVSAKTAPIQDSSSPDLFPLSLPYPFMHRILQRVQADIEHVFYNYAYQHLPIILEQNGWQYPEAANLDQWATEFSKHIGNIARPKNWAYKPLPAILASVKDIHHAFSNRTRLDADSFRAYLSDVEALTAILQDPTYPNALTLIREEADNALANIRSNKEDLWEEMTPSLDAIARQHGELDRRREQMIAWASDRHLEYRDRAGQVMERSVADCMNMSEFSSDLEEGEIRDDEDMVCLLD